MYLLLNTRLQATLTQKVDWNQNIQEIPDDNKIKLEQRCVQFGGRGGGGGENGGGGPN